MNFGVQGDATAYFGRVETDAIGSVVFPIRIIINLTRFVDDGLEFIFLNLIRSNLVQRIFRFSDGSDQRQFNIVNEGGIVAVNASRIFPEIRLINDDFVVYEDNVTYHQAPPPDLQLPTTLDFDLNLIAAGIGRENSEHLQLTESTVGNIFITEPLGKLCIIFCCVATVCSCSVVLMYRCLSW